MATMFGVMEVVAMVDRGVAEVAVVAMAELLVGGVDLFFDSIRSFRILLWR